MITLAGVPLVIPDKRRKLARWLEQYLPLMDLRDQCGPVALNSQRTQSRSGFKSGVGLPLPNYPDPPAPKINTLYWPTGASRWARGYFLATSTQLEQILEEVGESNAAIELVLEDEDRGTSITVDVHLLPPRPLTSGPAEDGLVNLYLLPVVDKRYYWQWKYAGTPVVDEGDSWATLYSRLGTQLGVSIATESVHADYKKPDPDELNRRYENAAVMLDATAHSCGQRIVVDLDGTVRAMSFTTAETRLSSNLQEYALLAGGPVDLNPAAVTPAGVMITFPKWREHQPDPNGDLYEFTVNAAEGQPDTPSTTKVIHSSAFADFTSKGGTPDNPSEIEALAQRIAADFYASLSHFDRSFLSLCEWQPTAFDDYVEFCFGSQTGDYSCDDENEQIDDDNPTLPWQAQTRVHSRPYNFGDEEQLQQFDEKKIYPRLARFKLQENLMPGEDADAWFVSGEDGDEVTEDELTVFDTLGDSFGFGGEDGGEFGWAEYKSDSLQWEVVSMDGSLTRPAITAASIASGATGSINLGSGVFVTAKNQSEGDADSGDMVIAHYSPRNEAWYFSVTAEGGRKFWKCSFNEDIEAGSVGEIVLSDTSIGTSGAVDATNWTFTSHAFQGRKGFAWKDIDDAYYFTADGLRWMLADLDGDLEATDLTAAVTNVISLDGGSSPSITDVDNQFGEYGKSGDRVLIVESPNAGSEKQCLVRVYRRDARWFRGLLNGVLSSTSSSATVDNIVSLDGSPAPTITTATNRFKQDGLDNASCLLVIDYNDLDEDDNPKALLVQVWGDAHRIGKADSAINAGASGTVSIWTGTPLSETDSTVNVTAYNRTSVDIPSGGWVKLTRIDGHYYAEPWSC